jgi:hypothetical protein
MSLEIYPFLLIGRQVFEVFPDDPLDFNGVGCGISFFIFNLVWVFSLLSLVTLAKGLSILFTFSKNQLLLSLIICIF